MSLVKLSIPPDQASYTQTDGTEVNRQQLDGGAGAYRADILNSTSQVVCQWSLGEFEYKYLRAFYRSVSERGSVPFLIDLILDKPCLTEHTAYFMPGTMTTAQIQGGTYTVGVTLEVIPIDPDESYDNSIVAVFNAYGYDAATILNLLNIVVNVDWPI